MTPTIPARARQADSADRTGLTARDAMHALGPQVDDHMVRTPDVSPVIDEHGYALGALALTP